MLVVVRGFFVSQVLLLHLHYKNLAVMTGQVTVGTATEAAREERMEFAVAAP